MYGFYVYRSPKIRLYDMPPYQFAFNNTCKLINMDKNNTTLGVDSTRN